MKPLAVDLCCGLGGWSEGLLAEGWDCIGFDVERHVYGSHKYPAQLVLQDILTLDGRQFRGKVSLITASPPCQNYSYMAMPWSKSKALAKWYRDPDHPERIEELNALFNACVRIGKEAECPIIIENVRGAQSWVGRARWNFGSYYLFADVPALMPITFKGLKGVPHRTAGHWTNPAEHEGHKVAGFRFDGSGRSFQSASVALGDGVKVGGISFSGYGSPGYKGAAFNGTAQKRLDGVKQGGSGAASGRKAASAMIAKIPLPLARHVASVFRP